jgi:hypothetical protein
MELKKYSLIDDIKKNGKKYINGKLEILNNNDIILIDELVEALNDNNKAIILKEKIDNNLNILSKYQSFDAIWVHLSLYILFEQEYTQYIKGKSGFPILNDNIKDNFLKNIGKTYVKLLYPYSKNDALELIENYIILNGNYGQKYYLYDLFKYDITNPYYQNIVMNDLKILNNKKPLIKFITHIINQLDKTGISQDMKILTPPMLKNKIFRTFLSNNLDISAKINFFLEHISATLSYDNNNIIPIFEDRYINAINIFMINQEIELINFFDYDNKIINEFKYLQYMDYILVKNKNARDFAIKYRESDRCSICCLTKEMHDKFTRNYLGKHHPFNKDNTKLKYKVIYTKFKTPIKCPNINIEKKKYDANNLKFVHMAGKSPFKQTSIVIKTFIDNPTLGNIDIICELSEHAFCYNNVMSENILSPSEKNNLINHKYDNIKYINDRLEGYDYEKYYQEPYVHICTSLAEGYGHYLNDARYCGSIIIANDNSPMNEIVTKEFGIIIPAYKHTYIGTWGEQIAQIHPEDLKNGILYLKTKTSEELNDMKKKAHLQALKDNNFFDIRYNNFIYNVLNDIKVDDLIDDKLEYETNENNYNNINMNNFSNDDKIIIERKKKYLEMK